MRLQRVRADSSPQRRPATLSDNITVPGLGLSMPGALGRRSAPIRTIATALRQQRHSGQYQIGGEIRTHRGTKRTHSTSTPSRPPQAPPPVDAKALRLSRLWHRHCCACPHDRDPGCGRRRLGHLRRPPVALLQA
jgi:hypothetical protein